MLAGDVPSAEAPAHVVDAHERARAYEIAAYLSAASFPLDIAAGPPAVPVPNPDIALNALVQHGAHALGCDRAFLSFIDDRSQFICAEMTRNQSIMATSPNHSLLLGTARIALEWGVCPYTMSVFHGKKVTLPDSPYLIANESYFFIKDFRMVPSFAERPFVAGYPHMVSYIEVPLRSLSGYILGSYCIVDDKERDFLHPDALRTINESAAAISQYLDLKRTERGRVRSERVMDGLCQFIGSHKPELLDSAQANPFALEIFGDTSQSALGSCCVENTEPGRRPSESTERGRQPFENTEPGQVPNVSTAHDNSKSTTVSPGKDYPPKETEQSLSARIDMLLSKAANMIGHAMNLDGFVFLDAVETGTRYSERPPSADSTNDASSPRADKKISPPAQPLAGYLDDASAASEMTGRPSQSLIRRLTAAYPTGHVFTIDEYGILEQDAQQAESRLGVGGTSASYDDCEELLECIPKSRYAIFLPLWHYQRESSYVNCLAWVSDPGKTLEVNDINSLTAFGNSLMAEIFRLEAATSTQQKSDFVSSVSHELRSPLHGILATVELMQEQPLDSHLLSMAQMIESCSYTLLDTFDHLLEFSKINSSREGQESAVAEGDVFSPSTQKLAIDLGSVAEEVLQAVSLGHNSVSQMEFALKKEHQGPLAGGVEHSPLPVLITTHIDHIQSLTSRMDPGIWKRILLNIFSNALRFTTSGHIDVSLAVIEGADVDSRCISLTVADSGVGMSREFLKYHLFTPFMQENNLVSGTGLGLHIVKNLVESIHGKMFVESKQYEGTRITVNIPFDGEPRPYNQLDGVGSLAPCAPTSNLTVSLINIASQTTPNSQTAPHLAPPPMLLQRCLRNICESSLGMTLVDDLPLKELLDKDVVLLDTHSLFSTDVLDFQQHFPEVITAMASRPFVVLGSSTTGVGQFFRDRGATFVSSPITRKSLGSALTNALNRDAHVEVISAPAPGAESQASLDPPSTSLLNGTGVGVAGTQPVDLPVRNIASAVGADTKASPPPPHSPSTIGTYNASPQQSPPLQSPSTAHTNASPPPPQSPSTIETNNTSSRQSPPPPYRFTRLLLVDDNPINLKLLAAFAQRTRLAYATACDGAEALRLFTAAAAEGKPFDCVFMDISMPVMDGFQATAAIRRFEEGRQRESSERWQGGEGVQGHRGGRCHVVALTGLGSREARSMARDSGFDLFLVKPVQFRNLEPLLRVQ